MPRRLGLPLLVLHRLGVVLFSGELVVDLSSGKVVAAADCDVSRLCFGKKDIFANVKLIQGFSSVGIEEDNTIGRTLIAHIGCVVLVIRSVFKMVEKEQALIAYPSFCMRSLVQNVWVLLYFNVSLRPYL
jgi:hypothetical protein